MAIAWTAGWIVRRIAPKRVVATSLPSGSTAVVTVSTVAWIGAARTSIAGSTVAVGRSIGVWIVAALGAADHFRGGAGRDCRRRRLVCRACHV